MAAVTTPPPSSKELGRAWPGAHPKARNSSTSTAVRITSWVSACGAWICKVRGAEGGAQIKGFRHGVQYLS
eukprot:1146594-Pelagomonas_calceolata.AAC.2